MAVTIARTTSNNPLVTDHDALADVLTDWEFIPMHGDLTVEIRDGHLSIFGEAEFQPYRADAVDHTDERYDNIDRDGFADAIAPYLEEDLIVQTQVHEKLRYPFGQRVFFVDAETELSKRVTSTDVVKLIETALLSDPEAVLGIPTEEDVPVVRDMLRHAYDQVADEYERQSNEEMNDLVATQGSLAQELLAQLSEQGHGRAGE